VSEWQETDIGRIPASWDVGTLGSISHVITDGAHSSPKPVDSEFYMASEKDMRYNHFDFRNCKTISRNDFEQLIVGNCSPQFGDILLSKDGANCLDLIFVYKQDNKIVLLSSIAIARLKDGYLPDFYRYFLLSPNAQDLMRNNYVSGSAIPSVILKDFKNVSVPILSLSEQKAIAEVLSSLDDKIDLLHRQNKTLEQMAETLFRQWFVEEAGEDWEEVLLSDLIEIKGGFSYKGKYIGEGSSLLLGMGCVSFNNRFLHTGARLYSGECPISHLVEPGDLVIATRQQSDNMPILGFPAIIPKSYEGKKVIVGTNLYRLINNSEFDNYFFYKLFRSAEYRSHILSCAKGSTVRMITKDAIESYVIRKPPTEIYNNYQSKSVKINNRINNIVEQIRTLESLRDTLLPKLMSGEVRIASHG